MTIKISGKQMDVGQSLSEHAQKAVEDMVNRYIGHALETNIVFSKDHHMFQTDLQVHISHHFVVNCQGRDADPYKAIAQSLEKLENRIKKYKDRLRSKKRDKTSFTEASRYVIDDQHVDTGKDTPITIAELGVSIESLTVSEAVMRLEVTDYPVIIFKNAAHDRLNVVYRRPDGNIGWVDAK